MVAQRINITTVIGEDRKLLIELPPDTPTGEVDLELVLRSTIQQPMKITNPAREAARAKLMAAGALSTIHHAPAGLKRPTEAELLRAGTPPPGTRSSEDILREIREED